MMPALTHFGPLSGLHRRSSGGSRARTGRLARTRSRARRALRGAGVAFAVLALIAAVLAPAASAQTRTIGTVVVANGWSSADSAVASALAALESDGNSDAVVLYATTRELTSRTANFIEDHDPSEVILIGGTAALSAGVEAEAVELVGRSSVRRIEGRDRFDTAAKAVPSTATTYIIANGFSAADTGVAAALAATRDDAAVLLATADSLTEHTERIIRDQQPLAVEFVGGTAVLSAALVERVGELAPAVPRIPRHSGASRTATAAAAAPNRSTTLVIANGWSPADMGVAAAYAAITSGAAVLYSETNSLTEPTENRIRALQPRAIVLVGGSAALDTSLHARLRTLAPSATLQRISGSDRIDTAVRAADGTLTDIATDPPAAPTSVTVTARNAGLAVSWVAPTRTADTSSNDDPEVTGYAIQYRACTAADKTCRSSPTWSIWRSHSHSGTRTSTIISGLTNSTTYQVQVRARNSAGLGAWSQTASGTPLAQTEKPSVPSGLTVEAANRLLQVSWSPSIPPRDGTVSGYEVQYRRCPSGSCGGWEAHDHSGTGTTTTITGLDNGTAYEVRVQASSSKGDSGWSPAKSATPELLPHFPGSPTLEPGVRMLTVRWNQPLPLELAISSYEVGYRACTAQDKTCPEGDSDSPPTWGAWRTRRPSGTALSTDITGLTNGTKYEIRVRARAANGVGPWSPAEGAVPVAAPAAPLRLTVDPGNELLKVSWDAPFNNGAEITGYKVQYCDTAASGGCSGDTNWMPDPARSVTNATTTDISGLGNDKRYEVRVLATNSEGDSPWSRRSGTPKALPEAPTLTASDLVPGDRKLTVSWTAPTTLYGTTITGYVVEYRPCTATPRTCETNPMWGNWQQRSFSGEATSEKQLTGLVNGTKYQVRVRARVSGGLGLRSEIQSSTPFGLPGKPTIRTVEPRNAGLAVTWARPSEGGSPITGYRVQRCDINDDCDADASWSPSSDATLSDIECEICEFEITGLDNDRTYRVRVRANIAGGNGPWSSTMSGTPAGVPDAPTLSATGLTAGARQIDASWSPPANNNGSPITGYVVGYRACTAADRTCPDGDDPTPTWGNWGTHSTSGGGTMSSIGSLTNGTKYEVRVRARNANGLGPWSETRMATPLAGPATPAGVTLDVGHQKLTVSWTEPSSSDSSTTEYEVQHQACTSTPPTCESSSTWGSWGTANTMITDTTAQITSLANDTAYRVQVRAKKGGSFSAWSQPKRAVPAAVPEAPSPVVTVQPQQLNVSWSSPVDNGSTVTSYVVGYRACTAADRTCPDGDDPKPTWGNWTTQSIAGTQIVFTGLTDGTAYQVRVRARNADGLGPWSAPVSRTPVGAPAKPSPPRVTPGNPGELVVNWIAPWDNGSMITDYDVEYQACIAIAEPDTNDLSCASSPAWGSWSTANITHTGIETTATIGSLTNGTAYQVRVIAKSAVGDGPWSKEVVATPVDRPSAPPDVEVASGNRVLIVSWGTPKWNGATVTGFKVRYCNTSDCDEPTDWTTRTVSDARIRSHTIPSLTNANSYRVEVLTTSRNKGDSGASLQVTEEPGGPSKPGQPRLTPGNGMISVTWSAPSKNHSDIIGYDVQHRVCTAATQQLCNSSPTWGEWIDNNHSGTTTSDSISSLINGQRYEVRVRAENAQGPGLWSSAARTTPTS